MYCLGAEFEWRRDVGRLGKGDQVEKGAWDDGGTEVV